MANNGILSEFSPSDISVFRKDFTQMIKVGGEIDRHYGKARHDLDDIIPKFEKLAIHFNKKYKGIKIKTKKGIDSFKARVLVKADGIKELFAESASRIPGLKSAGKSNFSHVDAGDAEKFAGFIDSLQDKVCISYSDLENGTSSVTASFDRNEKMVEMIYNQADAMNENSACFRICAFYALKHGYDKKIGIYTDASSFGFDSLLDEMEKREWYDRFNPEFLE